MSDVKTEINRQVTVNRNHAIIVLGQPTEEFIVALAHNGKYIHVFSGSKVFYKYRDADDMADDHDEYLSFPDLDTNTDLFLNLADNIPQEMLKFLHNFIEEDITSPELAYEVLKAKTKEKSFVLEPFFPDNIRDEQERISYLKTYTDEYPVVYGKGSLLHSTVSTKPQLKRIPCPIAIFRTAVTSVEELSLLLSNLTPEQEKYLEFVCGRSTLTEYYIEPVEPSATRSINSSLLHEPTNLPDLAYYTFMSGESLLTCGLPNKQVNLEPDWLKTIVNGHVQFESTSHPITEYSQNTLRFLYTRGLTQINRKTFSRDQDLLWLSTVSMTRGSKFFLVRGADGMVERVETLLEDPPGNLVPSYYIKLAGHGNVLLKVWNAKDLANVSINNLVCQQDWESIVKYRDFNPRYYKLYRNPVRLVDSEAIKRAPKLLQFISPELDGLENRIVESDVCVNALLHVNNPVIEVIYDEDDIKQYGNFLFSTNLRTKVETVLNADPITLQGLIKAVGDEPTALFRKFAERPLHFNTVHPTVVYLVPDELINFSTDDSSSSMMFEYNQLPDEKKIDLINFLTLVTTIVDPTVLFKMKITLNESGRFVQNWSVRPYSKRKMSQTYDTRSLNWYDAYSRGLEPQMFLNNDALQHANVQTRTSFIVETSGYSCKNAETPVLLEATDKKTDDPLLIYNPTRGCFFVEELVQSLENNGNKAFGGQYFPTVWSNTQLRELLFLAKYKLKDKQLVEALTKTLQLIDVNNIASEWQEFREVGQELDEWLDHLFYLAMYCRGWQGEPDPIPVTAEQARYPKNMDRQTSLVEVQLQKLMSNPLYERLKHLPCYTRLVNSDFITCVNRDSVVTIENRVHLLDNVQRTEACIRLSSNVFLTTFYFWLGAFRRQTVYKGRTLQNFHLIG